MSCKIGCDVQYGAQRSFVPKSRTEKAKTFYEWYAEKVTTIHDKVDEIQMLLTVLFCLGFIKTQIEDNIFMVAIVIGMVAFNIVKYGVATILKLSRN